MKPKISVVLYCYNSDKTISDTLNSLVSQTLKDVEIIILDDFSSDDSVNLINNFADKRIQYIRNTKRLGKYKSFNKAIRFIRGKYSVFMEGNETLEREKLRTQWLVMEKNSNLDILGTGVTINNKRTGTISSNIYPGDIHSFKLGLLKEKCFHRSSLLFRNSSLIKKGIKFRPEYDTEADYYLLSKYSNETQIKNLSSCLLTKNINEEVETANDTILADKIRLAQLGPFKVKISQADKRLHLKLIKEEYLSDQELTQTLTWIDRLKNANQKQKLHNQVYFDNATEHIISKAKEKNRLGGWSIEKELLNFITSKIPTGKTILEFGSGDGTNAMLENYSVISIEHNKDYAFNRSDRHICLYAPIQNDWYDQMVVKYALAMKSDLILVDGPPLNLRKGILKGLSLFKDISIPIIFDDIDRQLDKKTMTSFCAKMGYQYEIHTGNKKQFGYCIKK